MRIELTTSSLPRKCSTTELQRLVVVASSEFNLVKSPTRDPRLRTPDYPKSGRRGSNSPPIAWKAIALPNELLPLLPAEALVKAGIELKELLKENCSFLKDIPSASLR
jgi:hypothetical protein